MTPGSPLPTRRHILHTTLAATAYLAAPVFADDKPSSKIRLACFGVRGRGDSVMRSFAANSDVTITWLCDIDKNILASRADAMEKLTGLKPKTTMRFEDIMADRDVDALVVCTPDHWHAPLTIHGCLAGKDVYVEKPDGHNICEGQLMVAAARKKDRIVQMGTQARSAPYMHEAAQFVQSGAIGKVLYGRAWETARQGAIPRVPDEDPPPPVDYDRWLGPAPLRKFNRYRFHSNWRWFFDYGAGDLGNDGVHRIDYCRMLMGINEMPSRTLCSGGKLFFDDAQEWPDTQMCTWEFGGPAGQPKQIITYEMRIWSKPHLLGLTEAGAVYGENGWVLLNNSSWQAFDPSGKVIKQGGDGKAQEAHVRNFLDCVRSRKKEALNQEIYSGHISSVMCHAANIAWRTGLGAVTFDAKTETFAEKAANAHLSREYRKGYELPEV